MRAKFLFPLALIVLSGPAIADDCMVKEYAQYKDDTKSKFLRDLMADKYCHALSVADINIETANGKDLIIEKAKSLGGMTREITEWRATAAALRKDATQCRAEAQKMYDALRAAKAPAPKCPEKK